VTHQTSAELAPLEQVTMMLNDSSDISCTVPVFAGNEAAPFPGIRERKMTGIPGRPFPGRPGMKTLVSYSHLLTVITEYYYSSIGQMPTVALSASYGHLTQSCVSCHGPELCYVTGCLSFLVHVWNMLPTLLHLVEDATDARYLKAHLIDCGSGT